MPRWVVFLLVMLAVLLGAEAFYVQQARPVIKVAFRDNGHLQALPPVTKKKHVAVKKVIPDVESAESDSTNVSVDVEAIPMPSKMLPSSPDEIKVGMKEDQLQSTAGQPYLKTVTSDKGQLLEVYVFPGEDRDKVTVTQLKNGQVTAAYARVH